MNKTDIFLEKYKELEIAVAETYKYANSGSPIAFLEKKQEFSSVRSELKFCREVRNILSHNPRINNEYAIEPGDNLIAFLSKIIETIEHPLRAYDIAKRVENIIWCRKSDFVLETMHKMNEKGYAHVPILENGIVKGVFSDNTLFSYYISNTRQHISENMRFSDIYDYLPIEAHKQGIFAFMPSNTLVTDVEKTFERNFKRGRRIAMIFLTENGKQNEKLTGIITPWDVMGK